MQYRLLAFSYARKTSLRFYNRRLLNDAVLAIKTVARCGVEDQRLQSRNGIQTRTSLSAVNLEVFGRRFALVGDFFVFDNLPLIEAAQAGSFDSGNMDKHVF